MPSAHILLHVAHEGPARISRVLRARGFNEIVYRIFAGDQVPANIDAGDIVIVMGGPMGLSDLNTGRFAYLRDEVALLKACIANDTPVLGICLGAQLLAHAAGARVYPNRRPGPGGTLVPAREVGWAPVSFSPDLERPETLGLHSWEWMLHWHGDTFDLPPNAVLLASTPITPNQAFRINNAIGLQFHPEIDTHDVQTWLLADAAYAQAANGHDACERIAIDTARLLPSWHVVGDRLLENCIDAVTSSVAAS